MKEQEIINLVNEFITHNKLDTKSSKEEFVYPRYYLIGFLRRNTSLTFVHIAEMFNRFTRHGKGDHSFSHYGLKKEDELKDNRVYKIITTYVHKRFKDIELSLTPEHEQSLIRRILNCSNYIDMVKLKNELKARL